MPSPAERFWEKVERTNGCWNWRGAKGRNGYGYLTSGGRVISAHRFSLTLALGPLPERQPVMHSCDNRLCVNPGHLSLGSDAENMADMRAKGRNVPPPVLRGQAHPKRRRTHCPHGHPWTPENTRQLANARQCIACRKATLARYREHKRAS